MLSDRLGEDRDWKDGINAFRLYVRREIEGLKEQIKRLEKEKNNGAI